MQTWLMYKKVRRLLCAAAYSTNVTRNGALKEVLCTFTYKLYAHLRFSTHVRFWCTHAKNSIVCRARPFIHVEARTTRKGFMYIYAPSAVSTKRCVLYVWLRNLYPKKPKKNNKMIHEMTARGLLPRLVFIFWLSKNAFVRETTPVTNPKVATWETYGDEVALPDFRRAMRAEV